MIDFTTQKQWEKGLKHFDKLIKRTIFEEFRSNSNQNQRKTSDDNKEILQSNKLTQQIPLEQEPQLFSSHQNEEIQNQASLQLQEQKNSLQEPVLMQHQLSQKSPHQNIAAQNVGEPEAIAQNECLSFGDQIFITISSDSKENIEMSTNLDNEKRFFVLNYLGNTLDCMKEDLETQMNPINNFRKTLFTIINPKSIKPLENDQANIENTVNAEEEAFEDAQNNQLVYGQVFCLQHIDSKLYLTISRTKISKQLGKQEVSLQNLETIFGNNEEFIYSYCMIPNSKKRKLGESVKDQEKVLIRSYKDKNFFLNFQLEQPKFGMLNASKHFKSFFQINIYMMAIDQPLMHQGKEPLAPTLDNSEVQAKIQLGEQEEGIHQLLKTGDLIKIINVEKNQVLKCTERQMNKYVNYLAAKIIIPADELYGNSSQEISMNFPYFDKSQEILPQNFEVFFAEDVPESLSCFSIWEVQKASRQLKGGVFKNSDCLRFRNLATGHYLVQRNVNEQLMLTSNLRDQGCEFKISNNRGYFISEEQTFQISPHQLLNVYHFGIQKNKQVNNLVLQKEGQDFFRFVIYKKNQLVQMERSLKILNSLINYQVFLQEICFLKEKTKQQEELFIYDYQKINQNQYKLQQETQTIATILEDLLKLGQSTVNQPLVFKQWQSLLVELKVFDLLVMILKLIDSLMNANKKQKERKSLQKLKRHANHTISKLSPQIIVQVLLKQLVKSIFTNLVVFCKDSVQISNLIFENDEFFFSLLKDNFEECATLFKYAKFNLTYLQPSHFPDKQGEEILDWVKLIEPLSFTQTNLQDQTFIVEMITSAIVDLNFKSLKKQLFLEIVQNYSWF